jgi:uncharacterized protein (DUF1330 family)
MTAYCIFLRESPVRDPAAMGRYLAEGGPALANLKPLVGYGAITPLEGDAPDGIVVLEFPDVAAARAWYDSEEYQKVVGHRLAAADYRGFIVEGMAPRG